MNSDQCIVVATTVPVVLLAFVVESRSLWALSKRTNHVSIAWALKIYELGVVALSFYLEGVVFDGVGKGLNHSDGQDAEFGYIVIFGLLCIYIAAGRLFRREDDSE